MTTPADPSLDAHPVEYFRLGRRIRQGLSRCSQAAGKKSPDNVFYLWLQMDTGDVTCALTEDQWLNIVDEAASLGVNWLVVTLGGSPESRAHVTGLCRWAQATHGMVVCLHAPHGEIDDDERNLLLELPRESTYLLVDPSHAPAFAHLEAQGVAVGSANPALPGDREPCEYPHKMIFVDARGNLYTCGMVSGEHEFFLGSVFDGSLDQIIHNPQLPHSVSVTEPGAHGRCSGCPPLVARHLCQK